MIEEGVAVTLARMEGKLDLMNVQINATVTQGADHETRIRTMELASYVTTKMLAGWCVLVCAIASVIPLINLIHLGQSK